MLNLKEKLNSQSSMLTSFEDNSHLQAKLSRNKNTGGNFKIIIISKTKFIVKKFIEFKGSLTHHQKGVWLLKNKKYYLSWLQASVLQIIADINELLTINNAIYVINVKTEEHILPQILLPVVIKI